MLIDMGTSINKLNHVERSKGVQFKGFES